MQNLAPAIIETRASFPPSNHTSTQVVLSKVLQQADRAPISPLSYSVAVARRLLPSSSALPFVCFLAWSPASHEHTCRPSSWVDVPWQSATLSPFTYNCSTSVKFSGTEKTHTRTNSELLERWGTKESASCFETTPTGRPKPSEPHCRNSSCCGIIFHGPKYTTSCTERLMGVGRHAGKALALSAHPISVLKSGSACIV